MSQPLPITFSENESGLTLGKPGLLRLLLAAMRPHQWAKNLFIFAPLLFGRKLTDPAAIWQTLIAFAVFCLLASGLYIFNDWMDAEEDRAHPEKRNRPIASRALSIPVALAAATLMLIAAFWVSAAIGVKFLLVAGAYFVITLSYCLALKRAIVLDCLTIAVGFVLRVVAGAMAVNVAPTHWLIVCAFLLAAFLAFTKRRQELLTLDKIAGEHREVLSQYSVEYLEKVNTILIGAAIVCYALYTVAPETVERFGTDALIYGTGFVIYGMFRYLALIKDPSNGGNPSKMLTRDKPLLLTVLGWVIYNGAVIYQSNLTQLWSSIVWQ
ncbi:MAG: decaprenyl-phosphate phosphoribosyltransferase [Pyrinomonadaceae bacterium]